MYIKLFSFKPLYNHAVPFQLMKISSQHVAFELYLFLDLHQSKERFAKVALLTNHNMSSLEML